MNPKETKQTKSEGNYPGVAINVADNDRVTEAEEKERTKVLGYNPRNQK